MEQVKKTVDSILSNLEPSAQAPTRGRSQNDPIEACIRYHFGADYVDADMATMVPMPSQERALDILRATPRTTSLYLYSRANQTGKSFLLAARYREILKYYGVGFGVTRVISDAQLEKDLIDSQIYGDRGYIVSMYGDPRCRFVIFKDFAKLSKNRDLVMTPLFDFIDYLTANSREKTILLAANYSPEELSRLPHDNWVDIAARLNAKCKLVQL